MKICQICHDNDLINGKKFTNKKTTIYKHYNGHICDDCLPKAIIDTKISIDNANKNKKILKQLRYK